MTNRNRKLIFKTESFRVFSNTSVHDPYSVEWFLDDDRVSLFWDAGIFSYFFSVASLNDACLAGYIGTRLINPRTKEIDAEYLKSCIHFTDKLTAS